VSTPEDLEPAQSLDDVFADWKALHPGVRGIIAVRLLRCAREYDDLVREAEPSAEINPDIAVMQGKQREVVRGFIIATTILHATSDVSFVRVASDVDP
jgi:hypothetical protein